MNGATLDLTTSIVNLRRLADKIERGETIVLPRVATTTPAPAAIPAFPVAAAPASLPVPPPPPVVVVAAPAPLAPVFEVAPMAAPERSLVDDSPLREDDLARLEQVRTEVSELSGRRLSPWTRRRLEEARANEREILERLGYDSYLDVMLGLAAGSPQSDPGLASSSKLPSPASFAALPSLAEAAAAEGARIDKGGNDDGSFIDGASVHEIGERFIPAPVEVAPVAVDQPETVEPEVGAVPAGPSTIADWLRDSSFAGAGAELVDVNVGA